MIDWAAATGEVYLAFGFGCAAGYGFALRRDLKTANERIAELKSENGRLKKKLDEVHEKLWPTVMSKPKDDEMV